MENQANKRVIRPLIATLLIFSALAAIFLRRQLIVVDSGPLMLMGTVARIQLRCRNERIGRQALQSALKTLDEVDALMNPYRQDSELSRINQQAEKNPVRLSPETSKLLQKAQFYSQLTHGAFDITVTPLLTLWADAAKDNRLPTPEQLEQARRRVGFQKLSFSQDNDSPTLAFSSVGMRLNPSAIAKGYAVDRALQACRIPGVEAAMVDIGGEISCFGDNGAEGGWVIGVQDPFIGDENGPESERALWRLRLKNVSVATSGNYRRYVVIDGKHYSHIVDPRTGEPAEKLPSVTIIAEKTMDADALATAVSVLDPDEGLALIESLKGVEAFFVAGTSKNPRLYRTAGFAAYEIKP